jgi:APA family basic amino acid/polyamine antiporter
LIATSLYVAVSLVVTGMVNFKDLSADAPLSAAFTSIGIHWAGGF